MTTGLRETKKVATRDALIAAALSLAADRGVAGVTVEDIAAEAGVSARTFFNYFASKEEPFVADDVERVRRLVAAVADAPDGVPIWPVLSHALRATFDEAPAAAGRQSLKWQLIRSEPTLLAEALGVFGRLQNELVSEIARRDGRQVPALADRLAATAASAAVRAATETWLAEDGAVPLAELVAAALDALAPAFD
jgi:AcrR family transcriptional regulator